MLPLLQSCLSTLGPAAWTARTASRLIGGTGAAATRGPTCQLVWRVSVQLLPAAPEVHSETDERFHPAPCRLRFPPAACRAVPHLGRRRCSRKACHPAAGTRQAGAACCRGPSKLSSRSSRQRRRWLSRCPGFHPSKMWHLTLLDRLPHLKAHASGMAMASPLDGRVRNV